MYSACHGTLSEQARGFRGPLADLARASRPHDRQQSVLMRRMTSHPLTDLCLNVLSFPGIDRTATEEFLRRGRSVQCSKEFFDFVLAISMKQGRRARFILRERVMSIGHWQVLKQSEPGTAFIVVELVRWSAISRLEPGLSNGRMEDAGLSRLTELRLRSCGPRKT